MKKAFAVPVLFFLSLICGVYFLLPAYFEVKDLEEKTPKMRDLIEVHRNYISKLQGVTAKLEDYSEGLAKVNSALPEEVSFAHLLNFFQEKAEGNGLLMVSLSEGKVAKKEEEEETPLSPFLEESSFSLELVGTFSSFESFLRSVEDSSRLIEVQNISLEKSSEEGSLDISVNFKVYSYAR